MTKAAAMEVLAIERTTARFTGAVWWSVSLWIEDGQYVQWRRFETRADARAFARSVREGRHA